MIKNVFLAPTVEADGSPVVGPVEASWSERLEESGLAVKARHFGWKQNADEYISGSNALVLPNTTFNGDAQSAAMGFDSVHALNAAFRQGMPVFTEQPIPVSFEPLKQAFSDDPLIKEFAEIAHELGETVIGHNVNDLVREETGAP